MPLAFRLAVTSVIALTIALIVACAANTPTVIPTLAPATLVPTVAAQAEPSATHRPRQHATDHIEGLGDPVDAPHFVDSFPNHAQTLVQSPARVGINFDISLAAESQIIIERAGESITVGETTFDPRKIYMSAGLPADLGDGIYLARYRACFAGEGCTDGQIGFRVDASGVQNFMDLRGQAEVTIHLKDVTYQPNQIIISPGTKVTWLNDDPFEHFVNSDPHPTHNAFPELNSLEIPLNATYSFTFDRVGEYAFHCSAHVPQNMFGTILVREDTLPASPTPPAQAAAVPTVIAQVEPIPAPSLTSLPPTVAPTVIPPTPVPALPEPTALPAPTTSKVPEGSLPPQKFAAHFVSASPEHADRVATAPEKIEINFNFVLARNSSINVLKDGDKVTLGNLEFSENRLQMSVPLPNLGAGTYHVLYRACWPDKSCHDGEFAFVAAQ